MIKSCLDRKHCLIHKKLSNYLFLKKNDFWAFCVSVWPIYCHFPAILSQHIVWQTQLHYTYLFCMKPYIVFAIRFLPLTQVGQLSVIGKIQCTLYFLCRRCLRVSEKSEKQFDCRDISSTELKIVLNHKSTNQHCVHVYTCVHVTNPLCAGSASAP